MEAAGPLFYSFSDFELVLIAAFANQIANANIVLDGHRRICVVLVDGTSARSTIEFFVGMNHDVAMPVLRWGVRRILLQIAEELGVKTNTVWSYLPYSKGMYNQEYPTINAIRVRNSKRKAKEKALTCTDTAIWRSEWDSNPRTFLASLVFKTSSLNRSDT